MVLATAVAAAGCKNDEYDNRSPFDNVVYLDVAEADAIQLTTFKKTPDAGADLFGGDELPLGGGRSGEGRGRPVARCRLQRPQRDVVDDARRGLLRTCGR